MQDRQNAFPASNFILFIVLSFTVLFGWQIINAPKPDPNKVADAKKDGQDKEQQDDDAPADDEPADDAPADDAPADDAPADDEPADDEPADDEPADDEPGDKDRPPKIAPAVESEPPRNRHFVTLGSADPGPNNPFRMLVTATTKGGAIARAEMSSPRFRDLDDRTRRAGYLGHLTLDTSTRIVPKADRGKGCPVQVVGAGTPAATAGLKPGDLIVEFNKKKITSRKSLEAALLKTKPRQKNVPIVVLRPDGQSPPGAAANRKKLTLKVTLGRRPLQVIRPEDRHSFLLTMHEYGGRKSLPTPKDNKMLEIGKELPGVDLWSGEWSLGKPGFQGKPEDAKLIGKDFEEISFHRVLPKRGLQITKTYRLPKVPKESISDVNFKAYHLDFKLKIENVGPEDQKVAYQLDGAAGLPIEGHWFSSKVARGGIFSSAGMRDVTFQDDLGPQLVSCTSIADKDHEDPWQKRPIQYLGVDAKYFSAMFVPQKKNADEVWIDQSQPLLLGKVDKKRKNTTNVSCRMISKAEELAPKESIIHEFDLFIGPKRPDLLARYGLDDLVYYGWYSWAARPMSAVLHFFHDYMVFNYGIAILMLTIVVRGGMFPLSRKQALGARKMQELQPELKKLQEKYKNDMEGRSKAQQELFRRHNYNPLSGCLVLFIQLPIFVALYRTLMVDVELRQAPLIAESVRWCSDLSAPDMLIDWRAVMPDFINNGIGIFGLGPYFNILPILTIALFILQQKMFMPPAIDDQTRMQQKIMKYMMIFMGLIFFKVASGLCIYFIASSMWGLAERKLLPKPAEKPAPATPIDRSKSKPAATGRNGASGKKKGKKNRGKR